MIVLTNKHHVPFQIDDDDWEIVSRYSWRVLGGYPYTNIPSPTGQRSTTLHLLLLGPAPEGFEWDHRNQDKLDNHRENLRVVTRAINVRNTGTCSTNKSGVKGIHLGDNGRWRAQISANGIHVWLGTFNTFDQAKAARLAAEQQYWGENR